MARKCAGCGAVLGEKARFCKKCGAEAPARAVCRECGAALGEGAKFCKACGAAVALTKPTVCSCCGAEVSIGAKFCKKCGAPMEAANDKVILPPQDAEASTAAEPPKPQPTCPGCGAQIREGAVFCRKCGVSLKDSSNSKPRRPRINASSPQPRPDTRHRAMPAEEPPKAKRRILPRIVAAVLVVAIVITGVRHYIYRNEPDGGHDYGGHAGDGGRYESSGSLLDMSFMPDYTDAEVAAAPTARLPVSPEATFARDENIEVDFGGYNLLEQTSLSIARLPDRTLSSQGISVTAYDLTMENGINAFSLPVTVTLPLTCAPDEVSDIRVFDESAGVWEAVPSVADYEAGTITFRTTHFCTIAELKMKGARLQDMVDYIPLQNGYFAYAGDFESTGALTPVTLPMSAFTRLVEDSAGSSDSIMYMLETGRVEPDDAFIALMKGGDFAVGAYEEAATAANEFANRMTGVSDPLLGKVAKTFQAVGVAILVARMSYQAYNGVAVGDILWNNAPDVAAAACTAYGLAYAYPPALVAATVIFALSSLYDIGESLDNLSDAEYQLEAAYRAFCGTAEDYFSAHSCVMFSADTLELSVDSGDRLFEQEPGESAVEWVRLDPGGAGLTAALNVIFEHYAEQPEQLNAAVTKLLDDYVKLFFRQSDEAVVKYLDDYSILHDVTEKPSAEQIERFEARFRSHLYGKAAPIFREFAQKASDELMTRLYGDLVPGLLEQLNTVVSFQIVDDALGGDTFDNSAYATGNFTISFDYDDGRWANQRAKNYEQIKSRCVFAPQEDSNEVFRCNLYSLMQLNFPEAILISPADTGRGAIRLPFELEAPVTAVLLKNESYDGVYTGESSVTGLPAFYVGTADGHLYAAPAENNGYFDLELYKELTYNEATGNWEAYLKAADGMEFMYSLHFTPDGRDMRLNAQIIFSDETVYYNLMRTGPIEEELPASPEWTPPTDYELSPVIPR